MRDSVITVQNGMKRYHDQLIFKDVTFQMNASEVTVILGQSGAGKSTIFRIINQLETLTGGEVTVIDQKRIGFVMQDFQLFPHLSVLNNLLLPQRVVMKRGKRTALKRSGETLLKLHINHLSSKAISQLSGGEKQRVAIARLLVMDKDILLFDEPTSALDYDNISLFIELIKELKEEGKTIGIITHDRLFAAKVADQIYELYDGFLQSNNDMIEKEWYNISEVI